jgi:hypothetical protein
MPSLDELHNADLEHAAKIAAIMARVDGHDTMLAQHQAHLLKLDETIATVRESIGGLATKNDILDLQRIIGGAHERQLSDAHNSIPLKFAAWTSLASAIIAGIGVMAAFFHHG